MNRGMIIRGPGIREVRDIVLHAEGGSTARGLDLDEVSGLEISNLKVTVMGAASNLGIVALDSTYSIHTADIHVSGGLTEPGALRIATRP